MKRKIMLAVAASVVALLPVMAQAANKLIVKGTDGTTDKFVATDDAKIGIGVSVPGSGVHVKGTTVPATQILSQYSGTIPAESPGFMFVRQNPNGTNWLPVSGDRLGYILFGSQDSTNSANKYAAGIVATSDAPWTSTAVYSNLTFETQSGTVYRNEKMRITSAGNVGIGTNAPAQRLEVNGGVRLNTGTTRPACNTTNRGTLWFVKGGVGTADTLEVCAKDVNEIYAWKSLF